MPEEQDEIKKDILNERQELGKHLQQLELKVDRAIDLRTYVRGHRGVFAGLAVATGVVITSLLANRFRH